jgi:hypothetical protein
VNGGVSHPEAFAAWWDTLNPDGGADPTSGKP